MRRKRSYGKKVKRKNSAAYHRFANRGWQGPWHRLRCSSGLLSTAIYFSYYGNQEYNQLIDWQDASSTNVNQAFSPTSLALQSPVQCLDDRAYTNSSKLTYTTKKNLNLLLKPTVSNNCCTFFLRAGALELWYLPWLAWNFGRNFQPILRREEAGGFGDCQGMHAMAQTQTHQHTIILWIFSNPIWKKKKKVIF